MADQLTESDGRQLAVDLLRELGADWKNFDLSNVSDDEIRETLVARDPATLRRFLSVVLEKASPALERGFLCVLSDYLGSMVTDGCALDPEAYECHVERRRG